jgi:AcrR family transcriptional regulator
MARWEPNTQGRLADAALDLYRERGFDRTTVAEIAARAGLTERTFYRYFADKREVLFGGSDELQRLLVERVRAAPPARAPLDAIVDALVAADDEIFSVRRDFARRRQEVIAASPDLQERELVKLARLADALAAALRDRDVPDPTANLAAEAGIAIFKIAFERWTREPGDATLTDAIHAARLDLGSVAAPVRRRR